MRFLQLVAITLPLALACDNPANDACAGAFSQSAAAAATFCKTYTLTVHTSTSNLPAFATACSNKPSKLSSACSCLSVVAVPTTTPSSSSTTTLKTVTTTSVTATKTSTTVTTTSKTSATTATPTSTGGACVCTTFSQVANALKTCTNIVLQGIAVPAGTTLDLSSAKAGTTITFAEITTFGIDASNSFNPMIFGGTNVHITGAPGSMINGSGEAYWDGQGSNGGGAKPDHFIVVTKMVDSLIDNLYIVDWPVHCFDITKCSGVTITGLTLDNSNGYAPNSKSNGLPAAHNSDGFDFSSNTNMILSNTKVINQDDCVAVTSGTNVTVTGMYCSGGHGLSIGSVGGKSDNVVTDITFENSVIVNSENGARIKTNSGTTGSITNVVYKNIAISGISDYGIDVQQDYLNGGPTGKPTNGVTITGLTFTNVTGTVLSSAKDYYILCGSGSCSNFVFSGVHITGGTGDSCNYPPSGCP